MSAPASSPLHETPRLASLRGKILLTVGGTCFLAIVIASLALFAHETVNQRDRFRDDMEALARIVADYAVGPISFGDENGMRDALAVLQTRQEIIEAELQNSDGTVLHRFGTSEADEEMEAPANGEISNFAGWQLVIRYPLSYRGEDYGDLVLVADYQPIFLSTVKSFLPALFTLLALTLLIIGPIIWILAGLLLKGLNRLATSAAHIAETADYSIRAPESGEDEVGQLTRTFNAMLDKLMAADSDLRDTNEALNKEIAERARLEKALVESSRYAGMAEVATGVLHNVGNVLNSVNVSAQVVRERLEGSRISTLQRTVQLLAPHREDPSGFYANDPKAKLLPRFLTEIHQNLAEENRLIREEMVALNTNIEHIKEVVSAQQSLARSAGVEENLIASMLLEDAMRIHIASSKRHDIHFETENPEELRLVADRHATLQILVNLVSNAMHAVKRLGRDRRRVELSTRRDGDAIQFVVRDHGVGIATENLDRIFQHGFTTREDGHGFGLHSGALAAKRMGGALSVHSEGLDRGATFVLSLPSNPSVALRDRAKRSPNAPSPTPQPAPAAAASAAPAKDSTS
ncbi:ATP-binding protein [Actomonas aquatica]|uniref:histidine kinase n=1 Tax=Actomonas aquatica TaxID=2866162 RepID=A0ABZ1CCR7_9BACT|nr:ATP-binding protein [Opitutus sp. WL0086]WRQ89456.1 ATP-binding protein [Opitutus sp. WL0086]